MTYSLIRSDSRRIPLADESVHCVVTSEIGANNWGILLSLAGLQGAKLDEQRFHLFDGVERHPLEAGSHEMPPAGRVGFAYRFDSQGQVPPPEGGGL